MKNKFFAGHLALIAQLVPALTLLAAISIIGFQPAVFAQGSLTPPGAPAPTMKTLAQIEPRTPISSLPYNITSSGSYYVTTNLTGAGGGTNGITISVGNVTIDLNGFTLQPGTSGAGSGIFVLSTLTNVVVRNGAFNGWGGHGIDAWDGGFPRNMLFEKITVSGNGGNGIYTEAGSIIRDCIAIGNGESGFYSSGGEITGCVSRNNFSAGFTMSNGSLLHCSAEYNSNNGFILNSSRALDCDCLFNSSDGIVCDSTGNEIRRCRLLSNVGSGIIISAGSGGNVIEDCDIANNAIYGMSTGGSGGAYIARNNLGANTSGGMIISDSNNYIEGNHIVTQNGVYGIEVSGSGYTNNVIVRNVVIGGGSSVVNYNVSGDIGPIGAAASDTSPWGNISH